MSKKSQTSQKVSNQKTNTVSNDVGEGNTKILPPKDKVIRSRAWFFTLNNPKNHGFVSEKHVFELLNALNPGQIVMQLECGEEGTEHYQGGVYFKNQERFSTLKKLSDKFHWEIVGNWKKTILYCTKPETRIGGPWSKNIDLNHTVKSMPDPKGWQLECLKLIAGDPDPRKIYWLWEKKGNVGKSVLSTWLTDNRNAAVVSGSCKDISYILSEMESFPKIIVIDIPRSNDKQRISYQLIETLKSGRICSTKYKGRITRFNVPHILVFANEEPETSALSQDRWEIYWINNKNGSIHRKNMITDIEESEEECPSDYE